MSNYGQGHPRAVLSDDDVDLAYALVTEEHLTLSAVAVKFGVQKACIWKLVHGLTRGRKAVERKVRA